MVTVKECFWLVISPLLVIISFFTCIVSGAILGIFSGLDYWKTGWFGDENDR